MANIEQEKYELQKKLHALEEQKEALHKDYENSQAELKELTTKLEEKSAQYRVAETKLSIANARVKVLENEIDQAKRLIADKERIIARKNDEFSQKAKHAENSETETKQLRDEIEAAIKAKQGLEDDKTNLEEEVARLNLDLFASIGFRGERDQVRREIDDLNLQIVQAHAQIDELQGELDGFKRRPNTADKELGRVVGKGQALGIELEDLAGSDGEDSEETGSTESPILHATGRSHKGSTGGLDKADGSYGRGSTGEDLGTVKEEPKEGKVTSGPPADTAGPLLLPNVVDAGAAPPPPVVDTGAPLPPIVLKIRHISPLVLWIRVYYDIFNLFCLWALQLRQWRSPGRASKGIPSQSVNLADHDQIDFAIKRPKTWANLLQAVVRSAARPEFEFSGGPAQPPHSPNLPQVKVELRPVQFWDCFTALLAHIFVYGVVAACLFQYASLATERSIWLQANELTRQALVQLRGDSHMGHSYWWTIFGEQNWLEVLSFELSSWVEVDRSLPG